MKKLLIGILALITLTSVAFVAPAPVFADDWEECSCYDSQGNKTGDGKKPPTAILGNSVCDCGHGEAIMGILNLVVEIMSIGVGIIGVVGISITGIQYLTAGGDEGKTTKAKRRILEIVIGLAIYAVFYTLVNFLLPGR